MTHALFRHPLTGASRAGWPGARLLRRAAQAIAGVVGRAAHGPAEPRWPSAAARSVTQRAHEADEVRAWALELRHRDPGFAADLLAACARHESQPD